MITREQLERIGEVAAAEAITSMAVEKLRGLFPDIHFTCCMDDDVVSAVPLLECSAFNLYLVDSRSHCLCLTQDMEVATGVVLAEIEDEQ